MADGGIKVSGIYFSLKFGVQEKHYFCSEVHTETRNLRFKIRNLLIRTKIIAYKILFKSKIKNILERLKAINSFTGAREKYFKFNEGNPGDGICALFDIPDSNLRLYCIRYGNSLIILGGGGEKPKSVKAFQEVEKLREENYLLREISAQIANLIKEKEITFSEDGTEITGELEFENYE